MLNIKWLENDRKTLKHLYVNILEPHKSTENKSHRKPSLVIFLVLCVYILLSVKKHSFHKVQHKRLKGSKNQSCTQMKYYQKIKSYKSGVGKNS